MGLRRLLGFEHRRFSRYEAAVDVEFHAWDAAEEKPHSQKVQGRLTNISTRGACLQTNQALIEGHHLLRDNDLVMNMNTPLVLELPSSAEGKPWIVKAQVLWYNRTPANRPFRFNIGLKFIDISDTDRQQLEKLIHAAPLS